MLKQGTWPDLETTASAYGRPSTLHRSRLVTIVRHNVDLFPELSLQRLRLVTIIAPVAFLICLFALSDLGLRVWIGSTAIWLGIVFAILLVAAVAFSLWVFGLIDDQQRDLEYGRTLLDSVADHAIFMLDPEGRILTWAPGAQRITGFSPSEVVGQSFSVLYTPEDQAANVPQRHLEVAAREGHLEYEGWRLRKDGTRFWANVVMTALTGPDGKVLGYSKVSRDVSERKKAAEQIQILNDELQERVEELARANQQIEQRHRQLAAVNAAISAISSALEPEEVLQRIIDGARDLVEARYAALSVADDSGRILEFITSGITPNERAAIGSLPEGRGLLGVLIHDAKPIRLADIQADPRGSGFPPNHPPMKSLLGVPILSQGKAIGNLYLTDKLGRDEFTEEDQDLLVLLSNHAAVAITNARLYEEARSSRDQLSVWNRELEAKVAERSMQIERQSKEMTRRIFRAQEEERKRIARELHDETAQSLSTLLITLDVLELDIPPSAVKLQAGVERLRSLAKRTLDETRALSHDLRPTILDDVGLAAAIHWFADEWAKTFDLPVRVDVESEEAVRLPPDSELALFRIAQEALTNAGKYAEATTVRVSLRFPDANAKLTVKDDGKGFDVNSTTGPTREGGLGLYGMRERAELIGATLKIESAPGKGTCITVSAPIAGDENVDAANVSSKAPPVVGAVES